MDCAYLVHKIWGYYNKGVYVQTANQIDI